jgi:hypothetical protein
MRQVAEPGSEALPCSESGEWRGKRIWAEAGWAWLACKGGKRKHADVRPRWERRRAGMAREGGKKKKKRKRDERVGLGL